MTDFSMPTAFAPFLKLVQSNMELLTRFSASPDAMAQAGTELQALAQQNQEAIMKMMQSPAMMQVAQGMLKNYGDFMAEMGQQGMAAFSQAQSAVTQQTQKAAETMSAATRRPR